METKGIFCLFRPPSLVPIALAIVRRIYLDRKGVKKKHKKGLPWIKGMEK
jgi:hypothetical protein